MLIILLVTDPDLYRSPLELSGDRRRQIKYQYSSNIDEYVPSSRDPSTSARNLIHLSRSLNQQPAPQIYENHRIRCFQESFTYSSLSTSLSLPRPTAVDVVSLCGC